MTRVAVIDDHDLFREGVSAILSRHPDFNVVGEGRTSADACRVAEEVQPDILLLDIDLHSDPAPVTIRRVRRLAPHTHIVMLTMHRDRVLRDEMLQAGATAYVTKSVPSVDLVRILREIMAPLNPSQSVSNDQIPVRGHELLTVRERQVIYLIGKAQSNRSIASSLGITEGTVKRHSSSIYLKLGARSRMQAVQKALLLGILSP